MNGAAVPRTPASASRLVECLCALARNLWWSWQAGVVNIFRDLDPVRWRRLDHNPIALLEDMEPDEIEHRATEMALHNRIHRAHQRMAEYLQSRATWGDAHAGVLLARPVAYFSAEFGIHESLPIYSGGLGVLAGDHIKSASDLGVPMVAIGLFYDQGYFRQHLDVHGWQQESYVDVDVDRLPLVLVTTPSGAPVLIHLETRGGTIATRVWKVAAGRVMLLLLDSNCEGNKPEDRELTSRLYGGDVRTRIRQELVLGVGGLRALHALGIAPGVLHLNEGHSAFAAIEMVRHLMATDGLSIEEAARRVGQMTCFTTHTPVPAGHDRFSPELIEEHLGPLRDALGLSGDDLMALGRIDRQSSGEPFCMTVLALRLSRYANAVSGVHGHVSRRMWEPLWPGREADDVPIGHITNGVHVPSWLAPQMRRLYDRHLSPDWSTRSGEAEIWQRVDELEDAELWETHQLLKSRLLSFVRRRVARQRERRGELDGSELVLSPSVLTIGFARRFATYKRATLLLADLERLAPLFEGTHTHIQLIFAGKAHPEDRPGKELLQRIATLMRQAPFAGRVAFLEDYDINVGRHLVQGVDVWLNNPRRPLEACGTSGQKVVLNGGLNLSVLDGWWAEAYDGLNGFAIGLGQVHASEEAQDRRDAESLYRTLEEQVVPLYYTRDADGLPRGWIARVKRAIRTLGWRFNADRMVMDYTRNCYLPAAGGLSSRMVR